MVKLVAFLAWAEQNPVIAAALITGMFGLLKALLGRNNRKSDSQPPQPKSPS